MKELNTLAQRLRYAMEVLPPKKVKGVDLARIVGVKPPSVSDWLSGKSKTMEGENLLKVSKFLNVSPVWLATGKGEPEFDNLLIKNQDFASRLKDLMSKEESQIKTVNQLKDAIGVTYEMARRYTLGIAKPRDEKMQALADAFNVSISYLDHGTIDDLNDKSQKLLRQVPVISWAEATKWKGLNNLPENTEFEEWIPSNLQCGINGYGLVIVGESMLPDFKPNDRIYVNPEFQIKDFKTGDFVIITCDKEEEATFKKLIIETNNIYLESLNPKWYEKIIEFGKEFKFIGKVVGLYRNM